MDKGNKFVMKDLRDAFGKVYEQSRSVLMDVSPSVTFIQLKELIIIIN